MHLYIEDGKTVIDGTGCIVFKDAKLGCVELGEGVENMVISKFNITNVNSCSGLLRLKDALKNAKRVFLFTIRAKQNKHVGAVHVRCPSGYFNAVALTGITQDTIHELSHNDKFVCKKKD